MAKKISLKKALLMSGLSMAVCSAMLVGTTFAWFSSTAESGVNKIVAGNLKVELQHKVGEDWKDASNVQLFDTENVLWEPGMMVVSEAFRVANVGSLALKYSLSVNMEDKVKAAGHGLSEVIQYKVVAAEEVSELEETTRADVWASEDKAGQLSGVLYAAGTEDEDSETDALAVVLYWEPTDHDNDYNVESGAAQLETEFSINVQATQASFEKDSFGPEYDAGLIPGVTYVSGGYIPTSGKVILTGDAMLEGSESIEDLEVDLNGHTLTPEWSRDAYGDITLQNGDYVMTGTLAQQRRINARFAADDDEITLTFIGMNFINNIEGDEKNSPWNYVSEAVSVYINKNDGKVNLLFRDCTFANANVLVNTASGVSGEIDATFEGCTFNLTGKVDAIKVQGSSTIGTVVVNGCTFNMTPTASYVNVLNIDRNNTIVVSGSNNTVNVYKPAKGTVVQSAPNVNTIAGSLPKDTTINDYTNAVDSDNIKDALESAKPGDTIVFGDEISVDGGLNLEVTQDQTFNLLGNALKRDTASGRELYVRGDDITVTFENGDFITEKGNDVIRIDSGSPTIIFKDINFICTAAGSTGNGIIYNSSTTKVTLVFENCTFDKCYVDLKGEVDLTFNNCDFKWDDKAGSTFISLGWDSYGTIALNDCTAHYTRWNDNDGVLVGANSVLAGQTLTVSLNNISIVGEPDADSTKNPYVVYTSKSSAERVTVTEDGVNSFTHGGVAQWDSHLTNWDRT